jgi:hypothetical protein
MTRRPDRRLAASTLLAALAGLAAAGCGASSTEPSGLPLVLTIALASDTVAVKGSVEATIVAHNTNSRTVVVRGIYSCPFGIELIAAPTAAFVRAEPLSVAGAAPACGQAADLRIAAGDSVVERLRLTPQGLVGGDVLVDPTPGRYLIGPVLVAPDGLRPARAANSAAIVVR